MTIIKKLLHDFWLVKGKFFLCVLASLISAWGISSVVYSYLMSTRDFTENYSRSNAAALVVTLKNDSDTLLRVLRSDKNIEAVERREVVNGRIKNSEGNWIPFILFAAEDLNNTAVSKFELLDNRKATPNQVWIEKNSKGFLKDIVNQEIKFGDILSWKFVSGGFIHDAGMPPSQMEGTVYLYTTIGYFNQYLPKDVHRYLFSVKNKNADGQQLKNISEVIRERVTSAGGEVVNITIPPPGEHPHQNIVDGVSLLQSTFGGILSLLGIILLSLILLTWLYPQMTDIGIIKTMGASTRMIFTGYLAVLLIIISTGILIGLPLGYQTAKFYNRFIAMLQNFEVVKDPLPFTSHLLTIIPAIIIPVLFSLLPLLKTSKASIHAALNKVFYTPHKILFSVTQKLPGGSRSKYIMNNLFRSNQRTLLMILLLTTGIALFLTSSNLKYSINKDFDDYFKATNYDFVISLKDSVQDVPVLKKLPFVKEVAFVKRKGVQYQSPLKVYKESRTLVTLSPTYIIDSSLLLSGTLKKDCENCIYISQRFAPEFKGITPGTPINIEINKEGKAFIFSGIIKELTSGPQFYRFSRDTGIWYREIHIKIQDGFNAMEAATILDDSLLYNNINTDRIYNKLDGAVMLQNHLKPTFIIIQAMGIFTILVGLCGMLIVLNLSIKERLREMGIMKAVGGSVRAVSALFGMEYFIVNCLAAVTGVIAGYGLTWMLANTFGETIVNVAFNASIDWKFLFISLFVLLAIQTLLIVLYSRLKIRKSSAALLNNVF
jgi:putative ABC transport system permease protein